MSDDSSDCSDMSYKPIGCRGRQKNHSDQKKKRRIVMRIEFDDSDESTSASDRTSDEEDDVKNMSVGGNDLDDDGPSCSMNLRNRQKKKSINNDAGNSFDDSDDFQRNAATRRLRRGGQRINVLDVGFSDGSSSGSEITPQKNQRGKKYVFSDDERESKSPSKNYKFVDSNEQNQNLDEQGFASDSSSNDLLEKCPICLLTFRQQEIGSPSTCEHIFCANCIEAWSRNVQTCPIDRIEFQSIIVRDSYENRNIVRKINVDPNAKKELVLEDETVEEEDVTNCEICNRPDREDIMLLCDHCNQGYHMDCLSPPLSEVPDGSWFCDNCADSEEEDEDEDLHMLYEDIRDMGIPESRLRVREVHQPRILRTRQNERIRAAVIRRTRSVIERTQTTTSTINQSTLNRSSGRTTTTTATTRTAVSRKRSVNGKAKRKTYKRRNRRARQRTYVVEYDLNNFDEKFAIKTTKKVIKRRRSVRKKRTASKRGRKISADGVRMTASKRLAEQMGVKPDPKFTSHISGTVGGLSLFGGANDLEYFSESDNDGNIESEIHIETGHGTAVQTSVRISNYSSQRSRKGLLLGRQPNREIQDPTMEENNSSTDILSSILNMQDRWHSASRNLERVHINSDGTLNLPNVNATTPTGNTSSTPINPAKEKHSDHKQSENGPSAKDINQAPMYSRGGGNANFNNRGGGGYNNRSNNNQNSYRGGSGGGGNQYRHSTGGTASSSGFGGSTASSSGGINFNMIGRGNFNFSNNPNYNSPQNQQTNASPFQQRNFNQRNQQQNNQRNNNQQRHSLPFPINRNDPQQLQPPQNQLNPFGGGIPQTHLPPPHLLLNQQPQQNLQTSIGESSLFAGLPPPMSIPPPHINVAPPVRMSVPPPPAPPPVVIPPPVNNSLFQLNSDYGNNDDDSNCPNFAIYSHESLQVAKSSETYPTNTSEGVSNAASVSKEDDGNEDLVQLDDDDDEIPMPPDPKPTENVGSSELYEPENPTEEIDDENEENSNENENKSENENQINENVKIATKDDGDDYDDSDSSSDEDDNMKNNDKEQQKQINSEKYDPERDAMSQCSNNVEKEDVMENDNAEKALQNEIDKHAETVRSPSPAVSDIRLPEIETASSNRKGVLELYDDSDWEELDIDRPKEFQNKSSLKSNEKTNIAEKGNEDNENVNEPDRSYTPCLDENIDPEEHEIEGGSTTPIIENNSEGIRNDKDIEESNIENMGTELISEEEEELDRTNKDRKKNHKNGDKRGDRRENENVETFKKIGGKQKGRNYRGDKQPLSNNRRGAKKRRSRSYSRSRSRSRSVDSIRSRFGKSRSRSPRFRGRSDRSRSRSRSNNKENQGRWGGNFRDGGRLNKNNSIDQMNRFKRRELPRYNVRNVVGHQSPPKNVIKDRYGRDTSRNRRSSRSLSRGRRGPPPRSPFSRSRSRNRRLTLSLSPSPSFNRRRSLTPRPIRQFSPIRRRSTSGGRRTPPYRRRSRSPLRVMRSRSFSRGSEFRMNARKTTRQLRGVSPIRNLSRGRIRSRSVSMSPRYTPRLSRSRSKTPRPKGRKKKTKDSRKKKTKRRINSMSPSPNRRISRQPDPFEIEKPKKKKRRISHAKSPIQDDHGWSPSPSPPPQQIVNNYDYQIDKNVSWTPPMQSPLLGVFRANDARSVSRASRKEKTKRNKKKKKGEKRRDLRKEKKRKRRTETPEPAPSKEVFASGNNILVSVSFNKEATNSQHNQQTIVTLPPNREDLLSTRRASVDRVISTSAPTKKRKEKRKKIDTKPIAIIDLERSPFQVEQEPTDIIVLTDSEETHEREQREHSRDISHERRRSESCPRDVDTESHRNQRSVVSSGQRGENSPERLDTILEESYDLPQSGGPKTPPEPPVVKFNLLAKKQNKVRNPLHEEDDNLPSDAELNERQQQQQQENHRSDLDAIHVQSNQKIGPNTPPESGPCSPDAYDPFEPTKSPSISPRSPTPPPTQHDVSQNPICSENTGELRSNQKHTTGVENEQRREQIPGLGGNVPQSASLNPVDLVMALINSKSVTNSIQDLTNKPNEPQHNQHNNIGVVNSHEDPFREKVDENNAITVLSNLLITSGNMQHIPSISSPTPLTKKTLPLPKIGGSVGGSSSSGVNIRNGCGTSNNADDSFNMNDIESPYSPGSADYEDLFEPPPDAIGNKRRSKRGKPEVFDNLFGSSSPINMRLPSYTPSKKHKSTAAVGQTRKTRNKVGKPNEDNNKIYDDVPNSAVELHVKDKFLRKLNRQERVVEEVKLVLKPRFNRKQITKEDYKEIMRRAVPKICHSRSGEIDPFKIKKLIEAYVRKFRAKHKKLNIVNTGQVSSAVKCAAYLKKL